MRKVCVYRGEVSIGFRLVVIGQIVLVLCEECPRRIGGILSGELPVSVIEGIFVNVGKWTWGASCCELGLSLGSNPCTNCAGVPEKVDVLYRVGGSMWVCNSLCRSFLLGCPAGIPVPPCALWSMCAMTYTPQL